MSDIQHWTIEEYPAAVVDGIRGYKLPTEERPAVLVRCDGRNTRPLDANDWRELADVWQAAGLPLEPLDDGIGLSRALDYVEAFNERPGYAGWQVGASDGYDPHFVERLKACTARSEVKEALREAMQQGTVTPLRPDSMTRAKPHEVEYRPDLVLTAADLEAARLPVPAELAPIPTPSASAPPAPLPEPVAPPAEAVPVLGAGRRRAPTVHELIAPFIARVLADHPEWTAKQIHSEMCRAARERTYGLQMSRAGELVCSAAGRAFGLPAIEKAKTAHRKNRGSTVEPPSNR